jgi:hypothetical protein
MESVILIILIGLIGGVAVGLQGPLASMISQRLGMLESVFIVHLGGVFIALLPLLFLGGGKMEAVAMVYAWCRCVWSRGDQRDQLYAPTSGSVSRDHHNCCRSVISEHDPRSFWAIGSNGTAT